MATSQRLAALAVLSALAMSSDRRGPLSWLATRGIESVDLNEVLAGVDVDAVVRRVDVDALVRQVDVDDVVRRTDLDAAIARVDVDAVVARIEVDALLGRIDVPALLDRVDPDDMLDRVDVDRLLERVDVNRLLDRVDVDRLLDRVDVDRLVDRIDLDRAVDRVDMQRIVDRVDVKAVVDRAGIADVVAESTGAVAGSMLDVIRRQLVALDTIVERVAYRALGRDPDRRPGSPPGIEVNPRLPAKDGRTQVSGHYAGPVSRALAFVADSLIVFWVFTAATAAISWVLDSFGISVPQDPRLLTALFLVWAYAYWAVSLALTGRTGGKALVGLKVLERGGNPLTAAGAGIRTLVMPLSFVLALVGVAVVLVAPRRTSLHDAVARTCEVYDWGDRPAELPAPLTAWIARRGDALPEDLTDPTGHSRTGRRGPS